jgi:hypothetical protein
MVQPGGRLSLSSALGVLPVGVGNLDIVIDLDAVKESLAGVNEKKGRSLENGLSKWFIRKQRSLNMQSQIGSG